MPDNYCEFQTEQRRRMTSPGVSGCEWVVKILRYSVAIPRCSRQSEQTWKARAYKHFLDACIIQVKTRRRVSSVIYHIHEVKKKKINNECAASQTTGMFNSYCIIVGKGKYTVGWWNNFRGKTYPPGDPRAGCV